MIHNLQSCTAKECNLLFFLLVKELPHFLKVFKVFHRSLLN